MLSFWLCFLSFFYTVNSFSTEKEKVECYMCCDKKDSSLLIKSKEIFPCNCVNDVDKHICKECILKLIVTTINSEREKELTENNEKINILDLIFNHIRDEIKNKNNNDLQDFVKNIIKKAEKIGEYQELNAEEKLVYDNINEGKDEEENTIFYIGAEKDPTQKLNFIKSFLSLLKNFDVGSYYSFTRDIELSIYYNYNQNISIEEIKKWEEKDVEINLSVELDTTELQKKIKNEKVISIKCPYCQVNIKEESDFFLKKIFGEPSSQELSKKLSCLEYCGNICSDCF